MLLNILCRSTSFTGPEEVTSLVNSAPMLVPTKFPALKEKEFRFTFPWQMAKNSLANQVIAKRRLIMEDFKDAFPTGTKTIEFPLWIALTEVSSHCLLPVNEEVYTTTLFMISYSYGNLYNSIQWLNKNNQLKIIMIIWFLFCQLKFFNIFFCVP